MVAVPAAIPVTTPSMETVATVVLDDIQAFEAAAVPLPVRVRVLPTQSEVFPVIVGLALTVTEALT